MPPKAHVVSSPAPPAPEREFTVGRTYLVTRGGVARPATVLDSRKARTGQREAYITFVGEDKRLDAWVPSALLGDEVPAAGPSRLAGESEMSHTTNGAASPLPLDSERSTPEREHEIVTRVRNFEDVRFGEYLIRTWYYSPYPVADSGVGGSGSSAAGGSATTPSDMKRGRKRKDAPEEHNHDSKSAAARMAPRSASDVLAGGVGKGGEGAMGRLWVCDLCFKYMRTRAAWDHHTSSCKMEQPPGRKVYQRLNYTIWEVDGATAQLYCQNLCLFGKLFIDHKSVYFHVENFLFYVLCDAATSRRDQVMAFFSKEKHSYDDYNLACIVTFPPYQNRGCGKLLIEFSYYLTRHPKTRPESGDPGTPERPLSDLGLKGYMAYWVGVVLRLCRTLLADGVATSPAPETKPAVTEGRSLRARKPPTSAPTRKETVVVNGVELFKLPETIHKGHYTVTTTLKDFAQACHLRTDDVQMVLKELGFLRYRRAIPPKPVTIDIDDDTGGSEAQVDQSEWTDVEVVISRDAVEEQSIKWRVKDKPVLDEKYALLDRY